MSWPARRIGPIGVALFWLTAACGDGAGGGAHEPPLEGSGAEPEPPLPLEGGPESTMFSGWRLDCVLDEHRVTCQREGPGGRDAAGPSEWTFEVPPGDPWVQIAGWGGELIGRTRSGRVARVRLPRPAGDHAGVEWVALPDPVQQVAAGDDSCALTSRGGVWCWSSPDSEGRTQGDPAPRRVKLDVPARQLSVHSSTRCVVDRLSRAACWGALGNHGWLDPPAVVLRGVERVVAVDGRVCAIRGAPRRLVCFGMPHVYVLAPGSDLSSRTEVADLANVRDLVRFESSTCVRARGWLYCSRSPLQLSDDPFFEPPPGQPRPDPVRGPIPLFALRPVPDDARLWSAGESVCLTRGASHACSRPLSRLLGSGGGG